MFVCMCVLRLLSVLCLFTPLFTRALPQAHLWARVSAMASAPAKLPATHNIDEATSLISNNSEEQHASRVLLETKADPDALEDFYRPIRPEELQLRLDAYDKQVTRESKCTRETVRAVGDDVMKRVDALGDKIDAWQRLTSSKDQQQSAPTSSGTKRQKATADAGAADAPAAPQRRKRSRAFQLLRFTANGCTKLTQKDGKAALFVMDDFLDANGRRFAQGILMLKT